MSKLDVIRKKIKDNLPELRRKYHIKSLGIFGSYIRGEQKVRSDLDLLVEFSETPGLFKYVELENKLSDLVGIKVDLVSKGGLNIYLKDRILGEVQPIYG